MGRFPNPPESLHSCDAVVVPEHSENGCQIIGLHTHPAKADPHRLPLRPMGTTHRGTFVLWKHLDGREFLWGKWLQR